MEKMLCQKWFAKFCATGFSLDDAPQLGRPTEVDSDQIETLIKNNQHYNTQEIVDILKISKSILTGENENCGKDHMNFLANPIV